MANPGPTFVWLAAAGLLVGGLAAVGTDSAGTQPGDQPSVEQTSDSPGGYG